MTTIRLILTCEYHPRRKATYVGSFDAGITAKRNNKDGEYDVPIIYPLCNECAKMCRNIQNGYIALQKLENKVSKH